TVCMIPEEATDQYKKVREGILKCNAQRLRIFLYLFSLSIAAIPITALTWWLEYPHNKVINPILVCTWIFNASLNGYTYFKVRRRVRILKTIHKHASAIEDRTPGTSYTAILHHSDQCLAAFKELGVDISVVEETDED